MKHPKLIYLITIAITICTLHNHIFAQGWTQKKDIPVTGRWGPYSFSINNKVYVGGGYIGNQNNLNDLWEYDPATDDWTKKADVPGTIMGRTFAVSFTINGKGYVGLGTEGYNSPSSNFLDDLWEYDPATNTWSQKASLPDSARGSSSCFVINNKAYVVGGAPDYAQPTDDTWEYDPIQNTWTSKAAVPVAHFSSSAFSINNKGYISGGRNVVSSSLMTLNETYEYDAANDTWAKKADYCYAAGRSNAVSFVVNNKAYMGLGESSSGTTTFYYKEFCIYDPVANTWSQLNTFPGADRTNAVATTANGKAYVGGGFYHLGTEVYLKDWYEFDPAKLDVTSISNTQIQIYPNPAASTVHFDIPDNKKYIYEIRNIIGQEVMTGQASGNTNIDISSAKEGYYILSLSSGAEQLIMPFMVAR